MKNDINMQAKLHKLFMDGTKYHQAGDLTRALQCYRKVLTHFPRHADALHLTGIILADQGKLQEGLQHINRAILARSNFAPYYLNRALLYKRLKKFDEALFDLRKALAIGGANAQIYCHIGDMLNAKGNFDEAIDACKTALQLEPENTIARHNLGNNYLAKEEFVSAVACYQQVLAKTPDLPETLTNMGLALVGQNKVLEGIDYHQKALKVKPNFIQAYINLGIAYDHLGRSSDAKMVYDQALALEPNSAEVYTNLGINYKNQNLIEEALVCFRKVQALAPSAEAEFNEAISLLLLGDFSNGLPKYETRLYLKERSRDLVYPQPRWQGEDLTNKKLLIHVEQGLGDTIQFFRYLKLFPNPSNIVLTCQVELIYLLKPYFNNIIPRGMVTEHFDYQIPIMSLPLIFNTTLETIPFSDGYLQAPANHKLNGQFSNTDKLKVGIVWAGNKQHRNDHNRSINLSLFKEILDLENIIFYSLQWGERVADIEFAELSNKLIDTSVYIKDLSDTAAILSQLDLLISVDTAIVHLAGALAKPTWLLLPFSPDFRWLLNRCDSPWYKTAKLLRQKQIGAWQDVMQEVQEALCQIEHSHT